MSESQTKGFIQEFSDSATRHLKSIMEIPEQCWNIVEIFWKFIIKTQERRQWRRSVVFIVNFEQI